MTHGRVRELMEKRARPQPPRRPGTRAAGGHSHEHEHDINTIARAKIMAYLGARQAAATLVAAISQGLHDAALVIRDIAKDDPTPGDELDPEIAFTIRAFIDDVQRFQARLGINPDDEATDERQVLRRLGFTLDWLPDRE